MRLSVPKFARREATFGEWTLWKLQETGKSSFLWQEFKLMLPPSTPATRGGKRTYRLHWNPLEERFAKAYDRVTLENDHDDLYAMVELHMSLNYGPAWLTDPDGGALTQAEIDAERARLKELSRAATRRRAPG